MPEHLDMPDWINPANGSRMVWDPTSHTYIEAEDDIDGKKYQPWSGTGGTLDPAIHTLKPKNPEQTGILASWTPEEGDEVSYRKDFPHESGRPDDGTVGKVLSIGHDKHRGPMALVQFERTTGPGTFTQWTPLSSLTPGDSFEEAPSVIPANLQRGVADSPEEMASLVTHASGRIQPGMVVKVINQRGDFSENVGDVIGSGIGVVEGPVNRGSQRMWRVVMDDGGHRVVVSEDHIISAEESAPDSPSSIVDSPDDIAGMINHASRCPNCGGEIGVDGVCEDCQYQQFDAHDRNAPRSDLGPFPERIPKQNYLKTDHDYPSLASVRKLLMGEMRADPEHYSSWEHGLDEPHVAASLDACPECAGPVIEGQHGAICKLCGLKQPAVTLAKTAFIQAALMPLLGLLGRAAPAAAVAGETSAPAAGGLMGGIGSVMNMAKANPMASANMAGNLMGMGQQPQQATPPQPTNPQIMMGSITAGPKSNEAWQIEFVQRGESDNPEHDGTRGFQEQHSDSPEFLKDVNDDGGTKTEGDGGKDAQIPDEWLEEFESFSDEQKSAIQLLSEHMPTILIYAESEDKDGSEDPIINQVDEALEAVFPGYKNVGDSPKDNKKESSVNTHERLERVAARRPKMCPAHSDLVDASLIEEKSLLGQFAPSNYGGNYCKSPDFDGKCNFKPAMTTQKYWDDKEEQAVLRKQEREQASRDQRAEDLAGTTLDPAEHDVDFGDLDAHLNDTSDAQSASEISIDNSGANEYAPGLSEAPSAVQMPVAASVREALGPNGGRHPGRDNAPKRPGDTAAQPGALCDFCDQPASSGFQCAQVCPAHHEEIHAAGGLDIPEDHPLLQQWNGYTSSARTASVEVGTTVRRRSINPSHDDPIGVVVEMTTVHPSSPGRATVRFEDGHEESIPVADLESADGAGADHPTMDYGMSAPHPFEDEMSGPIGTDIDPAGDPYGAPAGVAPYSYASRTADHDFGDSQHSEDADSYDFGHGDKAHQSDSAVADDGQHEAGIKDVNGHPLKEGSTYLMSSEDYSVPDKVTIDKVAGSDITFTIHTGQMDFQESMSVADLELQKLSFKPADESPKEGSPDDLADDVPAPTEHQHADDGGNLSDFKAASAKVCPVCDGHTWTGDDMESGNWSRMCENCNGEGVVDDDEDGERSADRAKKTASLDDHFPWHAPELTQKTAGKDYSRHELSDLIKEGEGKLARNFGDLQLEDTHYISEADNIDDALWW